MSSVLYLPPGRPDRARAHDELGDDRRSVVDALASDEREDLAHREPAQRGEIHPHRRQRWTEVGGFGKVVESDDGDVVGYPYAAIGEPGHETECRLSLATKTAVIFGLAITSAAARQPDAASQDVTTGSGAGSPAAARASRQPRMRASVAS